MYKSMYELMEENVDLVTELEEEDDEDENERKSIDVLKQEEELKALFKLTIKNVMSKVESFREKKIIEEIKIKEEQEKKKGTTTTTTTTNPGETKTSALPSPLGIDIETIEQIYRSRMKTFLFKAIPITTKSHHYKDSIQGDKSSAKKRSKKLKKDCKKNCVTLQFFLYHYPVQFYNLNFQVYE